VINVFTMISYQDLAFAIDVWESFQPLVDLT